MSKSAPLPVGWSEEQRPVQDTTKIVVRGAVDVVLYQASASRPPGLSVAGSSAKAIQCLKTDYDGTTLVIGRAGATISIGDGDSGGGLSGVTISGVSGSGNIIAGRNIHISGQGNHRSSPMIAGGSINIHGGQQGPIIVGDVVMKNLEINMDGNTSAIRTTVATQGCAKVSITLPDAPKLRIEGSGSVTVPDIQAAKLDARIKGSGSVVVAAGHVQRLKAEILGSGDLDACQLVADTASLSVVGSGEIHAHVTQSVTARAVGAGEIHVGGNPPERSHSVVGAGDIRFVA